MPFLTCQGQIDVFGKPQEQKLKLEFSRHILASDAPPIHTIFLPKDCLAAKIIQNSNCFCLAFADGPSVPCEKLVDCFKIEHGLELELVDSEVVGDSVSFTGRVIWG